MRDRSTLVPQKAFKDCRLLNFNSCSHFCRVTTLYVCGGASRCWLSTHARRKERLKKNGPELMSVVVGQRKKSAWSILPSRAMCCKSEYRQDKLENSRIDSFAQQHQKLHTERHCSGQKRTQKMHARARNWPKTHCKMTPNP